MTGWLVDWPARTLLNVVYEHLVDRFDGPNGFDTEGFADFEARLYKPLIPPKPAPDGPAKVSQRALIAQLQGVMDGSSGGSIGEDPV